MRSAAGGWLQYDVALAADPASRRECYTNLRSTARELLDPGLAGDFFFMHKPPGLRVRFRPAFDEAARVDGILHARLDTWRTVGLLRHWRPAVYEPEARLFGGPVSMDSVHRLFTADSLLWLAYHAIGSGNSANGRPADAAGPAWALSLLMVRPLVDALGVSGGEDLDVWDRVRWQTGRSAETDDPVTLRGVADLAAALRIGWADPQRLVARISPRLHEPLAEYRRVVADEGPRWLRDYFNSGAAIVGPRAVLAYLIIFHWNRAGMSFARQSLFTEAMALHPAGARP